MRKWKWITAVILFCVFCTACSGNKEENETDEVIAEEESDNEEGQNLQMYTLASEIENVSIKLEIPGEFQQTDYSSESWLTLEIPGENEDSSTQLMMYLEADESVDVKKNMVEEVNYLMSANTDDWEELDYVEGVSAKHYEWSYVTYELDGLKGYKFCAKMENGSTLAATIELLGDNPKPFDIVTFIHQIDKGIIED